MPAILDQFAIAFTGKWRDLRYGTGSHVRQDKGEEHGPNPPNGSWGIVKARPTHRRTFPESPQRQEAVHKSLEAFWNQPVDRIAPNAKSCASSIWRLVYSLLPLGGFKRAAFFVCRTLTIPQLPLGGLKKNPQNGQSRVRMFRVLFCLTSFA